MKVKLHFWILGGFKESKTTALSTGDTSNYKIRPFWPLFSDIQFYCHTQLNQKLGKPYFSTQQEDSYKKI